MQKLAKISVSVALLRLIQQLAQPVRSRTFTHFCINGVRKASVDVVLRVGGLLILFLFQSSVRPLKWTSVLGLQLICLSLV